jgi:hypothetical protein
MKIAGLGSTSESGSISQRHGSADPDPHQNVMDPEHCWFWEEFVGYVLLISLLFCLLRMPRFEP